MLDEGLEEMGAVHVTLTLKNPFSVIDGEIEVDVALRRFLICPVVARLTNIEQVVGKVKGSDLSIEIARETQSVKLVLEEVVLLKMAKGMVVDGVVDTQ